MYFWLWTDSLGGGRSSGLCLDGFGFLLRIYGNRVEFFGFGEEALLAGFNPGGDLFDRQPLMEFLVQKILIFWKYFITELVIGHERNKMGPRVSSLVGKL